MKTLLFTCAASCAGLYALGQLADRANHALTLPGGESTLKLGLEAVTGRLTAQRLADLGLADLRAFTALEARPAPLLQPLPEPQKAAESARVASPPVITPRQPAIVAAWGEGGRVFVRLADGRTAQRLESGELAPVQPFDGAEVPFCQETP